METTRFGFWWRWNVYGPTRLNGPMGPMKEFGRVYYVVDDFGALCMVRRDRLQYSLFGE